jgi:hypothetical protein
MSKNMTDLKAPQVNLGRQLTPFSAGCAANR